MKPLSLFLLGTVWLIPSRDSQGEPLASDLRAVARPGQVFLTWRELPAPAGTALNVYVAARPITDPGTATRAARGIEPHSARDWWQDLASFTKGVTPAAPVGFVIANGGKPLDPQGGLFVYTVPQGSRGPLYFAVTHTTAGKEDLTVVLGTNSLRAPVEDALPAEAEPIWQRAGEAPSRGAGRAKPLWLSLHGKSGVVPDMEYLAFGDETMGWRASLPFKFSVRIENDEVVVRPTDRTWINRPHREAGDSGVPAIWTFWYGYNSRIDDHTAMAAGTPTNYTERRLLWIVRWVQRHYQTDPARQYCSGSSMGGCGTISFGLRHPELFAALHAGVPIVSYTYLGAGSARRLEPSCWTGPLTAEVRTDEGLPLLERMNGTKFVSAAPGDLPPLFVVHGRRDGSIPWENNPPFYRAMNEARQALSAYWDDGTHPTAGAQAPAEVQDWPKRLRRYRLDESYPVFTNTSSDKKPGDGRPGDGDLVGWINRGLEWSDVVDQAARYAVTVRAAYPGLVHPVHSDVTPRRLQKFTVLANKVYTWRFSASGRVVQSGTVRPDAAGRLTVPRLAITAEPRTLVLEPEG